MILVGEWPWPWFAGREKRTPWVPRYVTIIVFAVIRVIGAVFLKEIWEKKKARDDGRILTCKGMMLKSNSDLTKQSGSLSVLSVG